MAADDEASSSSTDSASSSSSSSPARLRPPRSAPASRTARGSLLPRATSLHDLQNWRVGAPVGQAAVRRVYRLSGTLTWTQRARNGLFGLFAAWHMAPGTLWNALGLLERSSGTFFTVACVCLSWLRVCAAKAGLLGDSADGARLVRRLPRRHGWHPWRGARLRKVGHGSPRNSIANTRAPPRLWWARCGRTSTSVIVPRRAA